MKKILLVILFPFVFFNSVSAQLYINEYSCANLTQYIDNNSSYEDWIEIYNKGNSAVSLAGYYLSDDINDLKKYQIPSGITAGSLGFTRFWASGRNTVSGAHYHTNFKLTQSKVYADWIIISDNNGNIIDKVQISRHQLGHSVGRKPDGGNTWGIFTAPTLNSSNTSTQYLRYAAKPKASAKAGYYKQKFTLTLTTTEPNSKIYYTSDGKLPTTASKLYTALGIKIDSTKVIKAITVSNNSGTILNSFIEINTFFFNVNHTLPVISVSGTNLDVLLNGDNSLKPAGCFEYFNLAKERTAITYGAFGPHGQDSWANDQRSMDYKTRDETGYDYAIRERLIPLSNRTEFQGLILRAAGDDNYPAAHHASNAGSAHIRDAFIQNLAIEGGLHLDGRTAAKAIIYLNGKYWGVYDMRERADEHDYTSIHYNQDKYNLQFIETWGTTWAQYGGSQAISDWGALTSFVNNKNMAIDSNFKYVSDRLDVKSLVDYMVLNSFTVTSDWLNYNTGWWRGMNPKGGHRKWGYILWDNDAVFGFYINYTGIPDTGSSALPCNIEGGSLSDPEGHITLLNKLRQNKKFDQYYKSRYIDLMNTVLSSKNVLAKLDSTINLLKPEMTMHAKRWFGTYNEWYSNAMKLRNYIVKRCAAMSSGLNTCYGLTGPYNTTFQVVPSGSGSLQINSLTIDQFPFTGKYHGKIDVLIKAIPKRDFEFDYWVVRKDTIKPDSTSWDAVLRIAGVDTIYTHFKSRSQKIAVQITEINYDNDVTKNAGTWLEIANTSNNTVDISGWKLQSGTVWKEFVFPPNSVMAANSRWILSSDTIKFKYIHGQINDMYAIPFDLSSNNEALYLYDTTGTTMCYIPFDNKQPWPLAANGAGRTMELLNDTLTGTIPAHWRNGCIGGSPGQSFSVCDDKIHISEINYNSYSAADAGDWFEIYNTGSSAINLDGYTIRTKNFYDAYKISSAISIAPKKRLVICEDTLRFKKVHPQVQNVYYMPGLKLSNAGDEIKIYNIQDTIVFSVVYEDSISFSAKADGKGFTLEYNYQTDDFSNGNNWSTNCFGGTPGDTAGNCEQGILFTELNYKSAVFNDAGDWFEIKNTSNNTYNMNGWTFSDSSAGGYTINQTYQLKPNDYLVLVADTAKFKQQYPSVKNYIGNLNFNLSSNGDKIRILNASNKLIQILAYDDSLPWPALVSGTGFTLELKDTNADLNLGSNWFRGCLGGSPGGKYIPCNDSIIVTEINYNSHNKADMGDWIELYNKSKQAIDISNWTFHDDNMNDTFIIAANTILQAGERLVLTNNYKKLIQVFPNVTNYQGDFNFGLSSLTDHIKLRDNNGRLRYGMAYNTDSLWSANANGGAYTLELMRDSIIYSQSRFWGNACPCGSPGTVAGNCTENIEFSEINYYSHYKLNSGDWVELSNKSLIPVDLSFHRLINGDSSGRYTIPKTDLLFYNDYKVLSADTAKFDQVHQGINRIGNINFDLKNTGEKIKLYTPNKILVATSVFDTAVNWPQGANGLGKTLERLNYIMNPNFAGAWYDGCLGGSPGRAFQACVYPLVISEINYHPAASLDAGMWLEVHNRSKDTMDLSGYNINNKFAFGPYIFPSKTKINPDERLVIAKDTAKFGTQYPGVSSQGNFQFSLYGSDQLSLTNSAGKLEYICSYSNTTPWPTTPDGNGFTLEFIDTATNALIPASWFAGCFGGSPGEAFTPCVTPVTITEINYNSHPKADAGDWMEIRNHTTKQVNISDWTLNFQTSGQSLKLKSNTLLQANERILIVSDSIKFKNIYPGLSAKIIYGMPPISGQDAITIFDRSGALMNTQLFDSAGTWPIANGTTFTLEKIDTATQNNNASAWRAGCPLGSPGTNYQPCNMDIAITEINYQSDGKINTGDWFEIINIGDKPLAMSGLQFTNGDSSQRFISNNKAVLFKNERLVLAENISSFTALNPITNLDGPSMIDLNDTNETVKVYTPENILAASVHYNHSGGWPMLSNGKGTTLEYMSGNPSSASSWLDGCIGGSPGISYIPCKYPLVFSEINHHSNVLMNTDDWIEIHNTTNQTLSLNKFQIRTTSNNYNFSNTTTIAANDYLVIYKDLTAFNTWWSSVSNKQGSLGFDLGSKDAIELYDSSGKLLVFADYESIAPWPANTDGTGKTMELSDTASNPLMGSSWFGGCFGGTPGAKYSTPCTYNGVAQTTTSKSIYLYPNPNNGLMTLQLPAELTFSQMYIFNMLGERVYTEQLRGESSKELNLHHLASGIYTLNLYNSGNYYVVKWIKE